MFCSEIELTIFLSWVRAKRRFEERNKIKTNENIFFILILSTNKNFYYSSVFNFAQAEIDLGLILSSLIYSFFASFFNPILS